MSVSGIGAVGYPVTYMARKAERRAESEAVGFMETIVGKAEQDKTKDYNEKAFDMVGPVAPQDVKDAWMEAAKETGVNGLGMSPDNGMLTHISKMMVQQMVDWHNGKPNPQDILGSTVQSALGTAKKALYGLENPLEPVSRKSLEVQQQIMKEKEFYKAFISKLEQL